MNHIINANWYLGTGNEIKFPEIISIINNCTKSGAKIFIGSDSFIRGKKVIFASAICLYGKDISRYFFYRKIENSSKYKILICRITEEVKKSVDLAELIINSCAISSNSLELHLDISPPQTNNGTSKFSEMLKGYVNAYGLGCKLKPHAWASQSVADRHSK